MKEIVSRDLSRDSLGPKNVSEVMNNCDKLS